MSKSRRPPSQDSEPAQAAPSLFSPLFGNPFQQPWPQTDPRYGMEAQRQERTERRLGRWSSALRDNFAEADTAAKGGDPDGFVSRADMASMAARHKDDPVGKAMRGLLKNQDAADLLDNAGGSDPGAQCDGMVTRADTDRVLASQRALSPEVHWHNSYEASTQPVQDALAFRRDGIDVASIEADVHLKDGKLVLGHTSAGDDVKKAPGQDEDDARGNTLAGRYLEPLQRAVEKGDGELPGGPMDLYVDLKDDEDKDSNKKLQQEVKPYEAMLGQSEGGELVRPGAVNLIVTGAGGKAKQDIKKQEQGVAVLDSPRRSAEWRDGPEGVAQAEKLAAQPASSNVRLWGHEEAPAARGTLALLGLPLSLDNPADVDQVTGPLTSCARDE